MKMYSGLFMVLFVLPLQSALLAALIFLLELSRVVYGSCSVCERLSECVIFTDMILHIGVQWI